MTAPEEFERPEDEPVPDVADRAQAIVDRVNDRRTLRQIGLACILFAPGMMYLEGQLDPARLANNIVHFHPF